MYWLNWGPDPWDLLNRLRGFLGTPNDRGFVG
jgi:hypothetical protein